MHIKLFENFINENNDEDYFDGSKQIGKIKIEAGKWSGMGNDTRSPYMVKVYHFDCYGGEIWSSSQVREIKKENLEEFFNKVINQIEQDWKGKEDQIPTSCHADYWRNFLKEIPIEEVVEKLTTEDLYKLTYNVEEKYAEIFEEELINLLRKINPNISKMGLSRITRNIDEHRENLRSAMNKSYMVTTAAREFILKLSEFAAKF